MSAAVSRVRVAHVVRPRPRRLPIEMTVPQLARMSGYTPQKMLRRLRLDGVVLRPRGFGTRRRHYFVTRTELAARAPWILQEIQSYGELYARAKRPKDNGDDNGDDD